MALIAISQLYVLTADFRFFTSNVIECAVPAIAFILNSFLRRYLIIAVLITVIFVGMLIWRVQTAPDLSFLQQWPSLLITGLFIFLVAALIGAALQANRIAP